MVKPCATAWSSSPARRRHSIATTDGPRPLVDRRGLEMINSQMPLTEKISRADHVVWNNGPASVLEDQAGDCSASPSPAQIMDEEQIDPTENSPTSAAAATLAPEPNEEPIPPSEPLDLNELQAMTPPRWRNCLSASICESIRAGPGISQIVDLVRHVLPRRTSGSNEGFLEQPSGWFCHPALVPSQFSPSAGRRRCSSRADSVSFGLRPGQVLAGTVRLPRDREKGLMLDRCFRSKDCRWKNGRRRPRSTT